MNRFSVFRLGRARALGGIFLMGAMAAGAKDSVPPSPDRPWSPPDLAAHQAQLESRRPEIPSDVVIDRHKVYHLPDLIDLAQRLNPDTKVAWQRAKQALAAVGLQEVAYYPMLSAAAASGYNRLFAPLPSLNINRAALIRAIETGGPASSAISLQSDGVLHLDILADTTLSLQWLLFDFGERAAAVRGAREELLMANLAFNATHQKLVFEVSRNYYTYNNQRDAVRVAQSALDTASTVPDAVAARFKNGLATEPELLQAEQQLAQSRFDLERALGNRTDSLVDLLISIGLSPSVQIQIADDFSGSLPTDIEALLFAAESALGEAKSQLQQSSDQAEREVWQTYTDLHTAISSENAAQALVKASQNAYSAVLSSYKVGLSTYTELVTSETRLTNARNALFQSRSAIHTAATALAFALGDLAQPNSNPTVTRIRR